jgi:hypothetical protein
MNDIQNEKVRLSVKPNPFLYALEVTLWALLVGGTPGAIGGFPALWLEGGLLKTVVVLLITWLLLGLALFIVVYIAACHLMFVVTDKRAIVRFSFWRMTTDGLSIAIETVKQIDITSYGATHGSIYLTYDKTFPRQNSKDSESDYPQTEPIRRARKEATRASVPIRRIDSIWGSRNIWRRFFGFYGFRGFDEFANIISEQQ